ncbi:unnamed protein product [Blepharisma stoltei]|uniref:NADPH:adrenodoxin oxidoreductase, mitochondrial n=1 Tax=Blepharisma stoltei TaxID=1481888 RepID=A0AAU9JGI4_9CILI|nr:unnamed protein product [Blepharisma stoltei]
MALRFSLVGSGPAAFFTAKSLLKSIPNCKIDIFEKFPTPYGLIRYGVAPDHPEIKNVITEFSQLGQLEQVRFFGNIKIGTDITHSQLIENYSAVIYAHGSSSDKALDIIGGHLSKSARSFVEWYNALPGCDSFSLKGIKKVAIIGNGNVAIDLVRIMGSPIDRLEKTDISNIALEELRSSQIENIEVIGRRGAIQSAMTVKELRMLSNIPGISIRVFEDEIRDSLNESSQKEIDVNYDKEHFANTRARKRLFDLINSFPREHKTNSRVKIDFRYLLSPIRYEQGILTLQKNALVGNSYKQIARPLDSTIEIPCDLLFRSIGYKGIHIDGELPYDNKEGILINTEGKISENTYVSGWAKTGPYGVIDATMRSSFETAETIIKDYNKGVFTPKEDKIHKILENKPVVTFQDWLKIDAYEISQGKLSGKPREKVKNIEKMLEIALNR